MSERLQKIKQDADKLAQAIQTLEVEVPDYIPIDQFGRLFGEIRKARKISMDEACQITGLSDKTIRKIEREPDALKTAKMGSVMLMADLIGVPLCVIT